MGASDRNKAFQPTKSSENYTAAENVAIKRGYNHIYTYPITVSDQKEGEYSTAGYERDIGTRRQAIY